MKFKPAVYSLLMALSVLVGPVWAQKSVGQHLSAAQFRQKMQQTNTKTVLDVRTAQETTAGILSGAINIDFFAPDFKRQLNQLDKAKPVFVYCAVGGRSGKAMQQLQRFGYKRVYNLSGGMQEWQKAGYPVVRTSSKLEH